MTGIGNKRQQMCRAMRVAKKRKQQEEQEQLSEALLAREDDESEDGIWHLAPSEDSESDGEEEEDCKITDSEELEEGEDWRDNCFSELLANRERKEEGHLSWNFNGRYQRSSNPSQRTLYRRAANGKELAKAASGSAKITTFFRTAAPGGPVPLPHLTPDQIRVQKRKSTYELLEKKIESKKEVMNKQTAIRHRAVLVFLQLQLKPLHGETREQMSFTVARTFGRGVYFARKLVTWENEWMKGGRIEEGKKGCFVKTKSWFNDEGVQLAVWEWIAGKSKVEGNTFRRILPVMYDSVLTGQTSQDTP
jgi:hypothetical protein